MPDLRLVPKTELDRIRGSDLSPDDRLALLADACRLNALVAVKRAGSGHLGSTFSAMDVVAYLFFEDLNTAAVGWDSPDRDVYFSSKGHDVPGLYATLFALGVIPRERLLRLRRLDGLDGHPDIGVPGIEANSGSLGMGISKGRGIAWAKRRLGRGGRVVVMVGDGELQEGQNYEGLQAAAQERLSGLTVVVDRNELQSDKPTDEIVSLGELEERFRSFGWHVASCDGHAPAELRATFASFREVDDRPQALVARTLKGRGVSFMEHPVALRDGGGTYRWHAGAPDDEAFERAFAELVDRLTARLSELELDPLALEPVATESTATAAMLEGEPESGAGARPAKVTDEYVVDAYGEELVRLGGERDDLVVLDADLASDCRVRAFELAYPDRFVECGIAEQDMVSTAAGLARHGLLPVVNSFASFLAARANEQIYNQVSEGSKVVYALHYAGLDPRRSGKVASVRPRHLASRGAARRDDRAAGKRRRDPSRRSLGDRGGRRHGRRQACDRAVSASNHDRRRARGRRGSDPPGRRRCCSRRVRAGHAQRGARGLGAPRRARDRGGRRRHALAQPLRRRLDQAARRLSAHRRSRGSLAGRRARRRAPPSPGREVVVFGVEGWPACGTPTEALRAHRLDGASLAERIGELLA